MQDIKYTMKGAVNKNMIQLTNKKVLITGAASGIGRAIAIGCVQAGASVLAIDIDADGLESLREELNKEKIHVYTADV